MDREKLYGKLREHCLSQQGCYACKIARYDPNHKCGRGYSYNLHNPYAHPVSESEVLKHYNIIFGNRLREIIEKRQANITFEEAKQRSDYKFILNGIENLIEDIRNNRMKDLYENGDGHIGTAILEIGYIDIEVNIYTYAQCVIGADPYDQKPLIEYFVCIKRGESKDDWESDGYLDYDPNVDWMADNWKEQLEKDMFEALNEYVNNTAYSYNRPN